MFAYSVKVNITNKIPSLKPTAEQIQRITTAAVKAVVDRVQKQNTDIHDAPLPPYSDKPVYVRLGEGFQHKLVLLSNSKFKHQRTVITSVGVLKASGVKIFNLKGNVNVRGRFKNSVVRTASGNSVRFPNRAAYKRFLGRSGLRDFTETGAMLADLGVVSKTSAYYYNQVIILGFRNTLQERKAKGNTYLADWVGLSPSDQVKLMRLVNDVYSRKLGVQAQFGTAAGYSALS